MSHRHRKAGMHAALIAGLITCALAAVSCEPASVNAPQNVVLFASSIPFPGETGVAVSDSIQVFFDTNVTPEMREHMAFVLIREEDESLVPGTVTATSRSFLFAPDLPLSGFKLYRATFSARVVLENGKLSRQFLGWRFATGDSL